MDGGEFSLQVLMSGCLSANSLKVAEWGYSNFDICFSFTGWSVALKSVYVHIYLHNDSIWLPSSVVVLCACPFLLYITLSM